MLKEKKQLLSFLEISIQPKVYERSDYVLYVWLYVALKNPGELRVSQVDVCKTVIYIIIWAAKTCRGELR